jgi:predicted PilT family ATPase
VRLRVVSRRGGASPADGAPAAGEGREWHPRLRATGKTVFIHLEPRLAGESVEVMLDGELLMEADVGPKGSVRVSRRSAQGRKLARAVNGDAEVTVRLSTD